MPKKPPYLLIASILSTVVLFGCGSGSTTATEPIDLGPPPDTRLISTIWTATDATTNANEPIQPITQLVVDATPPKLDFDDNFFYRIDDGGCLKYEYAYSFTSSELRYDPNRIGRPVSGVLCPERFNEAKRLLFDVISPAASWSISDSNPPIMTLIDSQENTYRFVGTSR